MKKAGVKRAVLVILALVLTLSLGSGPVSAAEPIKLGAFFALSGPAAFIGMPTKLVAELVVKKINSEGGINGRPLELVVGDTKGEPTQAVTVAKKFINVDKVAAVIGPTRTGTGMAVKKVFHQAELPVFMTVGGDPVIMGGKLGPFDWVFKSPQRSSVAVKKVFGYLKAKGWTKVAIITASDGFGRDGKRWLTKLGPEMGFEIIADESFNPRDADMTAQLTKIKAKSPQAVICWTIGPAGSIVAKNAAQIKLGTPLVQCHGLPDPKYIELAGAAAEGNLMPSTKLMAWQQLPDSDRQKPVIAEFVKLYTEAGYGKEFPINTHSGYAWDAIYIVAGAMKKVGTDPAKLREAIQQTKDYVGISGVYTLSPEDHNGLGVDSMIMVQVKNGKFVMAD